MKHDDPLLKKRVGKLYVVKLNGGRGNYYVCHCKCKAKVIAHRDELTNKTRTGCDTCMAEAARKRSERSKKIGKVSGEATRKKHLEAILEANGFADEDAFKKHIVAGLAAGKQLQEIGQGLGIAPMRMSRYVAKFGIAKVWAVDGKVIEIEGEMKNG